MAADRLLPTSASGVVPGPDYLDQVAEEVAALWKGAGLPLTAIGGTANALTATLAPPLVDGLATGMAFSLTPTATNTDAVTMAINGAAAISVVADDGTPLPAGGLTLGKTALLVVAAGALRVIGSSALRKFNAVQTFTANGTWDKPAGLPDDSLVLMKGWGAGGGGGGGPYPGSGGGGAYEEMTYRAGDLPAQLNVVVGAGAAGQNGGSSTISSVSPARTYLSAFGGGRGGNAPGGFTGGGGGAGGNSRATGNAGASPTVGTVGAGGLPQFGAGNGGGGSSGTGTSVAADGGNASAPWAGAGGAGGHDVVRNGGSSVFGGAGGANGTAGTSKYGGNGGGYGIAGQPRGGGGGPNAAGGRGEIIIQVIG